jgi:hypothetical protein
MMQQQGQSPILIEMEAQNIEEERRAAERRAAERRAAERRAPEREALAQPSASAERRPHMLDPIRRLLRAMRREDR